MAQWQRASMALKRLRVQLSLGPQRKWSDTIFPPQDTSMVEDKNNNNKGIDLSGALKNSDSGVKFQGRRVEHPFFPGTPKIIQWVIKYSGGLVKDEKQASYVILGFVALAIVIALVLIFGGGVGEVPLLPPEEELSPQF